jgi:uncharacterized protein
VNPFRYSGPVPVDELIDRDAEAATLLDVAASGNNSRLVAPRRYGKTSLLGRVRRDAENEGWSTVSVDFFGVLTAAEIAERIERAYAAQLQGRMASWFDGVRRALRPTLRAGGPVPAGVEVSLDAQAEAPLLDRLALPRRIHERTGTRTLVVFDEFQDVLAARDRLDATIRSEIQHHGDAASYVFAGSHFGMMRELFTDRRRAFYGQAAPLELPPLGAEDVAAFIAERFAASERDVGSALGPLLTAADGHPQRTMLLAHVLWHLTPTGGRADEETWAAAWDRVLNVEVRDELRAIWTGLSVGQRRALAAIAAGDGPLYGRAAERRHGGSRGGALQTAVRVLVDRGELSEDDRSVTGHRVVDPLLAAWVREGRGGG